MQDSVVYKRQPPELLPICEEPHNGVPTSHRWGHNHSPASAGLLLSKAGQPSHGGRTHVASGIPGAVQVTRFAITTLVDQRLAVKAKKLGRKGPLQIETLLTQ